MICINFSVFFLHNWLDLGLIHFTEEQNNHYWKSKLLKRSLSLNAPITIQLNRFKRELLLSITWTFQENSECVCIYIFVYTHICMHTQMNNICTIYIYIYNLTCMNLNTHTHTQHFNSEQKSEDILVQRHTE